MIKIVIKGATKSQILAEVWKHIFSHETAIFLLDTHTLESLIYRLRIKNKKKTQINLVF